VWQSLSLSFGCRPQFLSADDVFPWFVYGVITLETATPETPNKVVVWLQMLQLTAYRQSVCFEYLTSLPFCSTFIRTVTKHNLQCTDTGTTQRKQIYERHSQRTLTVLFLYYLEFPLFYQSPVCVISWSHVNAIFLQTWLDFNGHSVTRHSVARHSVAGDGASVARWSAAINLQIILHKQLGQTKRLTDN
jgi:hypothetical protein